ncbi:MAG: hypothetical protein ICV55_12110 [Coleofasciculus sp. C3-bin4]|nr:hypothetical protein [Coleofasciculus sp. C3-bin4]
MQSSPAYSPFTALTLKVVGLIMIVSSLLDFIILAIPFKPLDRAWQLGFTTQIVDRGIIPMVGIALLVAGYWIGNSIGGSSTEPKSSVQDLRFWAFLLSTLLGLIFLLLVPLHFINISKQSDEALKQITQKASQAEVQLDSQTKQVDAIVKDPQKLSELERAIESGQVQGEQLARLQALREQLQTFKKDPKALKEQVAAAQTQIRSGKLEAENRAKTEALKLGLRTGLSSLLLAVGYSAIGWTGLRSLGGTSPSRRKA